MELQNLQKQYLDPAPQLREKSHTISSESEIESFNKFISQTPNPTSIQNLLNNYLNFNSSDTTIKHTYQLITTLRRSLLNYYAFSENQSIEENLASQKKLDDLYYLLGQVQQNTLLTNDQKINGIFSYIYDDLTQDTFCDEVAGMFPKYHATLFISSLRKLVHELIICNKRIIEEQQRMKKNQEACLDFFKQLDFDNQFLSNYRYLLFKFVDRYKYLNRIPKKYWHALSEEEKIIILTELADFNEPISIYKLSARAIPQKTLLLQASIEELNSQRLIEEAIENKDEGFVITLIKHHLLSIQTFKFNGLSLWVTAAELSWFNVLEILFSKNPEGQVFYDNHFIIQAVPDMGGKVYIENDRIYDCDYELNTLLHLACKNNRVDIAKLLVNASNQTTITNIKNALSQTPLHLSMRYGNLELVELLIDAGADLNAFDYMRNNPIYYAVQNGRIEIIHYLLIKQLIEPSQLKKLLYTAIREGHSNIAELLIDYAPTLTNIVYKDYTPLQYAIIHKSEDCVKVLLRQPQICFDEIRDFKTEDDNYSHCNLLAFALIHKNEAIFKLLKSAASWQSVLTSLHIINSTNLLSLAIKNNYFEILKELLTEVNITGHLLESLCKIAITHQQQAICSYLLDHYPHEKIDFAALFIEAQYAPLEDLNFAKYLLEKTHKISNNFLKFVYARMADNNLQMCYLKPETLDYLLFRNPHLDLNVSIGHFHLSHLAVLNQDIHLLKKLKDHRVSFTIAPHGQHLNLLSFSILKNKETVFKWLLDHCGLLNHQDKHGLTALMHTIQCDEKHTKSYFKALLAAGADVNLLDKHGLTALHYAINTEQLAFASDLYHHNGLHISNEHKPAIIDYAIQQSERNGTRPSFQLLQITINHYVQKAIAMSEDTFIKVASYQFKPYKFEKHSHSPMIIELLKNKICYEKLPKTFESLLNYCLIFYKVPFDKLCIQHELLHHLVQLPNYQAVSTILKEVKKMFNSVALTELINQRNEDGLTPWQLATAENRKCLIDLNIVVKRPNTIFNSNVFHENTNTEISSFKPMTIIRH